MGVPGTFLRFCGAAALVLLIFPVYQMLRSEVPAVTLVLTLVLLVLFAVVYGWVWLHPVPSEPVPSSPEAVVVLATLAVGFNIAFSTELRWAVLFVYVAVAAGFALPGRKGLVAVGMVILLALATLLAVYRFQPLVIQRDLALGAPNSLLQLALVGLGAAGVRRLIETTTELRAAREEVARLVVEEERHRFARDLHDLLGHSLSLITLKSELAGRLLAQQPDIAATEVQDIERLARAALHEVREAVSGYRQATLTTELAEAHATLAAAHIACQVEADQRVLPAHVEAGFAWAVREGVTNVVRHSQATCCLIRFTRDKQSARLEIIDNGIGGNVTQPGNGLAGLAERVAAYGGQIETRQVVPTGCCLCATLPLLRPTRQEHDV